MIEQWAYVVDADLTEAEQHAYGVRIGDDHWWCAGCLAAPQGRYGAQRGENWPDLGRAPNGLRLDIEHRPNGTVVRRPACPERGT